MKFIKFLFACIWIAIMLAIINALIMGAGHGIKESAMGIVNLIAFGVMVFAWLIFPYTIAPMLQITESPFKRFSMRNSSTAAAGFVTLLVVASSMDALVETDKSKATPGQSQQSDPFAK